MYFKCYLLVVFLMCISSLDATHGDEVDRKSPSATQVPPPRDMLSELDEEKKAKTPMMKLENHIFKAAYYSAQKSIMLKTKNEGSIDKKNILIVNRWHKLMNVHIVRAQIYALEIGLNSQWICNKLNKVRGQQLRQIVLDRRLNKIKKYIKKAASYSVKKAVILANKNTSELYEYDMSLVNEWQYSMNQCLGKAERHAAKIKKDRLF